MQKTRTYNSNSITYRKFQKNYLWSTIISCKITFITLVDEIRMTKKSLNLPPELNIANILVISDARMKSNKMQWRHSTKIWWGDLKIKKTLALGVARSPNRSCSLQTLWSRRNLKVIRLLLNSWFFLVKLTVSINFFHSICTCKHLVDHFELG